MTTATQAPPVRRRKTLQEASLLEGPMMLLKSIRGFSSHRSLVWLACVPVALLGLGFHLRRQSRRAAGTTQPSGQQLWLLVATILVIFMNAGCHGSRHVPEERVNILSKNLFVPPCGDRYWVMVIH